MAPPKEADNKEVENVSDENVCMAEAAAARQARDEEARRQASTAEAKLAKIKRKYRYFDTPEGEDIDKKLLAILEPATMTGLIFSTIDVVCSHTPRTYRQIIGRYAYITLPFVGVAAAFVSVANLATRIRKKNDKVNWIAGGIASGLVFGAWWGTGVGTVSAASLFALLAVIQKDMVDSNWHWVPRTSSYPFHSPAAKGFNHRWYDFTLLGERPRNWVTTEAERDEVMKARKWPDIEAEQVVEEDAGPPAETEPEPEPTKKK